MTTKESEKMKNRERKGEKDGGTEIKEGRETVEKQETSLQGRVFC